MPRSPLFGRRIHISGSVSNDAAIAITADVVAARELIKAVTIELLTLGATFVAPIDAENVRSVDGQPICFDWLIWETIGNNLHRRPAEAGGPLVIAVQHHKNEDQVPAQFQSLWDKLRSSDLVKIESAAQWNMNIKRLEIQARWGDILLVLGGTEGVQHLANLYHDAGRPVVPLNAPISPAAAGARKLFDFARSGNNARRLFRTDGQLDAQGWINRINFPTRWAIPDRAREVIQLLEAIERPTAFAVRLLNPDHPDFKDVEDYFVGVVKPIVEDELGHKLVVVDGKQPFEYPRVDQEIFEKLHRGALVVADVTGARPNCFIELGYALGRGLRTMVLARKGTEHPFDIATLGGHHWIVDASLEEKRRQLREHWKAVRNRPPLVPMEPLIP